MGNFKNEIQEQMFNRHTHAEIVKDFNPSEIVYVEKNVIDLLEEMKNQVIQWVLKNSENIEGKIIIDKETLYKAYKAEELNVNI